MRNPLEKFVGLLTLMTFAVSSCIACSTYVRRTVITTSDQDGRKYHTSVARLVGPLGSRTERKSATGFAISEDHLVTAGHFCESIVTMAAIKGIKPMIGVIGASSDGTLYKVGEAEIIAYKDKKPDLCLLSLPGHKLNPLPILDTMDMVQTEDPVTIIGAPAREFPVRRDGRIISLLTPARVRDYEEMIFIAISIQRGSSGSPVIWHGYVIGVAVSVPKNLHASALAVRGDHLISFLEEYID